MQQFEAEIVVARKQVQISGPLKNTETAYADFIKAHLSTPSTCLQSLSNCTGYVGTQFTTSIVFTLSIVLAEIYNCSATSSNTQYETGIIISVLYALTFSTILNMKIQLLLQFICIVIAVGCLFLTLSMGTVSIYVMVGILISIILVFLAKLAVALQEYAYSQNTNAGFSFQSNLILAVFLGWKTYQLTLNQLGIYTFNYAGLLSTMFALTIVNIIKVNSLFDYDVLHVVNILQQNSNTTPIKEGSQLVLPANTITVLIDQTRQQNESANADNDSELCESTAIVYESKLRTIITAVFILCNGGYFFYIVSISSSSTTTAVFSAIQSFLRISLLLLTCEYQKVIGGQSNDIFKYYLIWASDAFWIFCAALLVNYSSMLGLDTETTILNWICPLLAVKLINYINKSVHTELDNKLYCPFLLLYVLPLSMRELPVVMGATFGGYLLDAVATLYAIPILVVWMNRAAVLAFFGQAMAALKQRNYKFELFDELKLVRFNYESIVQSFLYTHVIILGCLYNCISTTKTLMITYFILFLAPLLLHFGCMHNSSNYAKQLPQRYKPSLINMGILVASIVYIVLAFSNSIGSNHQSWSLAVGMNVFLFTLVTEVDRMAVVYLPVYSHFLRVSIISFFFVFVYLPFVTVFIAGYYSSSFAPDYLYYYTLGGFFYIWLLLTLIGVAVHWVLNLTAKSQKDLFIAQYMCSEMHNLNMRENVEKILMISNMYEKLNQKSEDLLKYLKSEENIVVVVHQQKHEEYDYELVEPDDPLASQGLKVKATPLNPLDLIHLIKAKQLAKEEEPPEDQHPVVTYFKEKERNRIEITKHNDQNNNYKELKRIADSHFTVNQRELQRTDEFKELQAATAEQICETMAKLYLFLSQPSPCLSHQTFTAFFRILQNTNAQDDSTLYDRFSHSGLMDQTKFKTFILDYTEFKYDMKDQPLKNILQTFCCRQITPLLLHGGSELIRCFLQRKKITLSDESKMLWLSDQPTQQKVEAFSLLKQKELKKKARLLNGGPKAAELKQKGQNQEEGNEQIEFERPKAKMSTKVKRQLKDKKLMKPESVYASLVNSLIECYIYYEKQAENFKIKTIKFGLSNLLAVIAKISDLVFIFAYPTVHLLISYFQNNFTRGDYLFSTVSFSVLISLASASILIYILLILYHKKDFEVGRLGLDQNMRSFDFHNLKFYTTRILFLLGSGLANYIMSIGLNSFICSTNTGNLYNFSSTACYSNAQYVYMMLSLLMLVLYWPLSAITFPFSTAQDRNLEIKYKSEYEIIYQQFKFLINGYNTLLNPVSFQQEQFIVSVLRVVVCCALAFLFYRMEPCSYELFNRIEGKVYILVTIMSFAGALCYLVGLLYACIITGSLMGLYLAYFIYSTVKTYTSLSNQKEQNDIIEDNIKNQNIKIQIIRDIQPQRDLPAPTIIAKPTAKRIIQSKTGAVVPDDQVDDKQEEKSAVKLMSDEISSKPPKANFAQFKNSKRSVFF